MKLFILCLVVLFGRIVDVALSTIRTIMTVRGKPHIAATIGFFEVFIWFLVVREALNTDIESIFIALCYALGYALGTFIGGMIVKLFIRGTVTMQIVTMDNQDLFNELRDKGYGVTVVDVRGVNSQKKRVMLFIELDAKYQKEVRNIIKKHDEKAFIFVNETKMHLNGYFKQDKK